MTGRFIRLSKMSQGVVSGHHYFSKSHDYLDMLQSKHLSAEEGEWLRDAPLPVYGYVKHY